MSYESEPTSSESAITVASEAERRVQLAKERLTAHLHALDVRAREVALQTAWLAGMVLLGIAGVAAAASMFGRRRRRRRHPYYDYADARPYGDARPRGLGTGLLLTALGLLTRRARSF